MAVNLIPPLLIYIPRKNFSFFYRSICDVTRKVPFQSNKTIKKVRGILFLSVFYLLTEKAFKKTKHCIIPSMVSPVTQNVPDKCLPLRPITLDMAGVMLADTKAPFLGVLPFPVVPENDEGKTNSVPEID